MNELEKKLYKLLKSYCYSEQKSVEFINNSIDEILNMQLFKTCLDKEKIKKTVYDAYVTNIGITNPDAEFLLKSNKDINWMENKPKSAVYFERYIDFLREEDFPEESLDKMRKSTYEILSKCADPENKYDVENQKKKGLVMGDIQSGKTANYSALINLAADYGYKVIVLLAGLTDSLRVQTQKRIDSGFIGAKSESISSLDVKFIGVGEEDKKYYAVPLTNTNSDFGKGIRENQNTNPSDFNKPLILVVKKNKNVLTEVKNYLKPGQNNITSENILIIDDEADNASVNTKINEEPSIINKLIRDLFNNFKIASYVGFTATPFANIFINPYDDDLTNKDLFPSDFIVQLNEPSSYFGANKVFVNKGSLNKPKYDHIEILDPEEDNFLLSTHKKDDDIFEDLPESLESAINNFLLVNVIRTLRGKKNKHRTMMINISRFNKVQYRILDKVNNYVDDLKNVIEQTYKLDFEDFIRNRYNKKLYQEYNTEFYNEIRKKFSWDQIQKELNNEVQQFVVTVVNNQNNKNRFNYDDYENDGARVIAIGGFILSRGLTLEGLMISYFNRKANAYDTVLQMCRWFGYRPGYEDLCRIYMTQENIDNFEDVIEAVKDLKSQFTQMKIEGKTPEDFGLMVKQSPSRLNTQMYIATAHEILKYEKMNITDKNKMRNTLSKTMQLNYTGTAPDTHKLYNDKTINLNNKKSIEELFENLKEKDFEIINEKGKIYVERIPKTYISNMVSKLKIPYLTNGLDVEILAEFIKSSKDMPEWDLTIATGTTNVELSENEVGTWNFFGVEQILTTRSFEIKEDENIIRISGNKNRLAEPGIFATGFEESEKEKITKKSSKEYLNIRKRPILAIYPIRLRKEKPNYEEQKAINNFNFGEPLFGFALGFPGIKTDERVAYVLNKVKIEQLSMKFEDEEGYDPNED